MNVISKLALHRIRTHPKRSAAIAAAIILTALLFMTVMSITVSIAQSLQLSMMLATGSDVHCLINADAYTLTPHELLELVKRSSGVADAMLVTSMKEFTDEFHPTWRFGTNQLFAFDSQSCLDHIFTETLVGAFPANENELLLDPEEYPTLNIGDELTLTLTHIDDSNGYTVEIPYEKTFTVSGFVTSYADRNFTAITRATPELVEQYPGQVEVYVNFTSSWNIAARADALVESLEEYLAPDGELSLLINNAYLSANPLDILKNPANCALIFVSLAVIFSAAFLLIYNIYSVALTEDMQLLGLLGVIGMTHRQQRRLTALGALYISVAALPIGLILGYFIGWRLLSPIFMSMSGEVLPYRFNPIILLLTVLFTLFTLLFSATRPLKSIKRLAPIERVDSRAGNYGKRKVKHSKKTATVARLALASMLREPKRLIVTSLSAALSVLLFVFVGAVADAVREISLNQLQLVDCRVGWKKDTDYGTSPISLSLGYTLPESLEAELAALEHAESVDVIRYAGLTVKTNARIAEAAKGIIEMYPSMEESYRPFIEGNAPAYVIGVPERYIKYIVMERDSYGNDVLYGERTELQSGDYILMAGSNYRFALDLINGELAASQSLGKDYTVLHSSANSAPLSRVCGSFYTSDHGMIFVLPMEIFEREFPESHIFAYTVDATDEDERQLTDEITALCAGIEGEDGMYLGVGSVLDGMETFTTRMTSVRLVGYSLAAMIFLIAVINMANSAFMNAITRRREFAMLEAVGMTSRQLGLELLAENSFVAVIAAAGLVLGVPVIELVMNEAFGLGVEMKLGFSLVMLAVILAVCVFVSAAAFRMIRRSSTVERLRGE